MKERPVVPLLLSMALPMVISMMVNSLYNIVDSFLWRRSVRSHDSTVFGVSGAEFYQWQWESVLASESMR